jgi:hypothetical protein
LLLCSLTELKAINIIMDFTELGRPGISVIILWDGDEESRKKEAVKVGALEATMSMHRTRLLTLQWARCNRCNG